MLKDLEKVRKDPPQKRSEENFKYVLRKFFRFLQGDFRDPGKNFEFVRQRYFPGVFEAHEIDRYFKLTTVAPKPKTEQSEHFQQEAEKKVQRQHGPANSHFTFAIPLNYSKAFVNKLFSVEPFREALVQFMDSKLRDLAKREMMSKSRAYACRFLPYFQKVNAELLFYAMTNLLMEGKSPFWLVIEVDAAIAEVKGRISGIERQLKSDSKSG